MTNEFALIAPAGLRLVLARHGQTPSNVKKILDTVPPGPGLTDLGKTQAAALAERLGDEKVVAVHASTALRAQQTAAPLAARHGLDVQVVEGTHEIYVGELEGLGGQRELLMFEDVYHRWHQGELDAPMPGGETGRQALTRFLAGVRSAVEGVTAGAVVLVSHGAMLRLAGRHLVDLGDSRVAEDEHLPNTGLIVLESTGAGWRCLTWDGVH